MKTIEGVIISNKMIKTAVVEVVRRVPHPLYKKLVKKSSKFKVDTGEFQVSVGDRVRIIETRPISKDKNFKIMEVLDKKPATASNAVVARKDKTK